jgi:hypothetical protein
MYVLLHLKPAERVDLSNSQPSSSYLATFFDKKPSSSSGQLIYALVSSSTLCLALLLLRFAFFYSVKLCMVCIYLWIDARAWWAFIFDAIVWTFAFFYGMDLCQSMDL